MRRRPYSVILFDEIEKAHHDVFNVLLQLLDDGRLTDGQGRTVDFKNSVVIMTSNIASQLILDFKGQDYEKMKTQSLEVLRQHFRPEFLNRVDEIVVFHPLTKPELRTSSTSKSSTCANGSRIARSSLELTDGARDYFAESGYDPSYGARPLRRMIQRELETALARKLISGEVRDGQKVIVDATRRAWSSSRTAETGRIAIHALYE